MRNAFRGSLQSQYTHSHLTSYVFFPSASVSDPSLVAACCSKWVAALTPQTPAELWNCYHGSVSIMWWTGLYPNKTLFISPFLFPGGLLKKPSSNRPPTAICKNLAKTRDWVSSLHFGFNLIVYINPNHNNRKNTAPLHWRAFNSVPENSIYLIMSN